jgi:putative tricarboxylic transport membrane protein
LRKFDYEEAPLLLAFILGPLLEQAFRQSMIMSNGHLSIFLVRPTSLVALLFCVVLFVSSGISIFRKAREKLAEIN